MSQKLNYLVENLLSQMDYVDYAYLQSPNVDKGEVDHTLITSYPKEWTDIYFERGYQLTDPVVIGAQKSPVPFLWGEDHTNQRDLGQGKPVFKDAQDFGIYQGVVTSIGNPLNPDALLSLTLPRGKSISSETDSFFVLSSYLTLVGNLIYRFANTDVKEVSPRDLKDAVEMVANAYDTCSSFYPLVTLSSKKHSMH